MIHDRHVTADSYARPVNDATIMLAIPVLGRAERLKPLLDSIDGNTRSPHYTVFVCSPGDDAAIAAATVLPAETMIVPWEPDRGDYARKINAACAAYPAYDWVFTGATDIEFTPAWDIAAFTSAKLRERDGSPPVGVIGTIDECNPRTKDARHSTHSLVARWFVNGLDGTLLHEGYWHNFVDDELLDRARALRCYSPSPAVVRHFHPNHNTAPDDDTYRRGAQNFEQDRRHFLRRRGRRYR